MFEITYGDNSQYFERVDVETLLDYLKESYEGYMHIVKVKYQSKELNVDSLYKSLKFR